MGELKILIPINYANKFRVTRIKFQLKLVKTAKLSALQDMQILVPSPRNT